MLLANSLWLVSGKTFQGDFLQRDRHAYQAELDTVNFTDLQTVHRVNDWVSAHTEKMIPTIVQPGDFDENTVLALVNALYFKGAWSKPFNKEYTKNWAFTLLSGEKKQVPMMQRNGGFTCYEDEKLQIARLPYGNGQLGMLIFLPKTTASGSNPLRDLTAQLTPEHWQQWLRGLHDSGDNDTLVLPRFKADNSVELSKPLSAMGMGAAFAPGADFADMVKGGGIRINLLLHKTAIDVNEKGTEAAAVTMTGLTSGGIIMTQQPFRMVVDHPFFFAIAAEDGTILFLGSIVDPR